jgi:hypothetical protein
MIWKLGENVNSKSIYARVGSGGVTFSSNLLFVMSSATWPAEKFTARVYVKSNT